MNAIDKKEQQQVWENLWTEMQRIKTEPKEQRVFNYFDVLTWVSAKKNQIDFIEINPN